MSGIGEQPKTVLYLLGGSPNDLLNHFIANAMRRPLVMAPAEATKMKTNLM